MHARVKRRIMMYGPDNGDDANGNEETPPSDGAEATEEKSTALSVEENPASIILHASSYNKSITSNLTEEPDFMTNSGEYNNIFILAFGMAGAVGILIIVLLTALCIRGRRKPRSHSSVRSSDPSSKNKSWAEEGSIRRDKMKKQSPKANNKELCPTGSTPKSKMNTATYSSSVSTKLDLESGLLSLPPGSKSAIKSWTNKSEALSLPPKRISKTEDANQRISAITKQKPKRKETPKKQEIDPQKKTRQRKMIALSKLTLPSPR